MADQKLKKSAEELRSKGRGGDTILAHINPQEAAILKMMGGAGTKNPDTGLPEFLRIQAEGDRPPPGTPGVLAGTVYANDAPDPNANKGFFGQLAKVDPSAAISRELTNLTSPVVDPIKKAVSTGLADVDKNLSLSKNAPVIASIALAFAVPAIGSQIGASLMQAGVVTSAASASATALAAGATAAQAAAAAAAATATATAIGTAIASATFQVAQGVPVTQAVQNSIIAATVGTQAPGVAKQVNDIVGSPAVTNLIVSTGASAVQTAATGGSEADIVRNATGALVGSGVTSATGSNVVGRTAGGGVTGGVTGALMGAAGAIGSDVARPAGTTATTAPTTQATLTQDLTDAQVSQIQNALGISVSDATSNDVKLALGPLIAPLGAGAAIVSDSVIPLIGIFGAKAVSDTIDYFKAKNDSSGFYNWVNENMQAADDRVQNKLSLNPAGAGRGFVNPPVVTPITPSQAAISGSYGAGFSGAGGGAGAGVTAGEATAGEAEARDFLVAQKVTNPEIDFETLAREPALNEPPTDQKIIDLIQPGIASTPATVPPGTAPADRDILAFSGITQPAGSTAVTTPTQAPTQAAPVAGPVPVTPVAAPTFTPATFTPAIAPEYEQPVRGPVIDDFPFSRQPTGEPPPFVPPAVEPPPPPPPVVSEPPLPPVVTEPPPPPPEVVVEPEPPLVDVPPAEEVVPPDEEDKLPAEEEKPPKEEEPPEEEDKPPGEKEDKFKPDLFIYSGKRPARRPRTELGTTLQGPFAPSTTLGQALTGYRGAGEIEGKKTGKPRRDVWNEESLRLKDALGL